VTNDEEQEEMLTHNPEMRSTLAISIFVTLAAIVIALIFWVCSRLFQSQLALQSAPRDLRGRISKGVWAPRGMEPERKHLNVGNFRELGRNLEVSARIAGTERNCATGWRRGWDSNPRDPFGPNGFQDRRFQPLTHPSGCPESNRRTPTLPYLKGGAFDKQT
jgi:hypothetical protein